MFKKLLFLCFFCFNCYAVTGSNNEDQIKQGVTKVLNDSIACWNSTDLSCFMDFYAKNNDTLFISGTQILHGWQQFYDNYQKKYAADKTGMGQLEIQIIDINVLDSKHAFLYGRWKNKHQNLESNGVISMIFVKTGNKWQIMVTHSNE